MLHLELDSRRSRVEEPPLDLYDKWLGGRGLAGHYLAPAVTESWDSPRLPLLLFTGPLVGTPSPTPGRMVFMSRSPLTGTICDSSVGGSLGFQMKRAGWDGLVITGRSDRLLGIEIVDDRVELVDAAPLAGMETGPVLERCREKGGCALVGPAAEQGVAFANIRVDRGSFAGRGGLGLVMAAKGIKYITVKGSGRVAVADREELARAREEIMRLGATSPVLQGELGLVRYGTAAIYDLIDSRRMMPTDNFRRTHHPRARESNAWAFHRRYDPVSKGCAGCYLRCKKVAADGRHLPEFETLSHFTAPVGNRDLETVMRANEICARHGMDTISAGAVLACRREVEGRDFRPGEIEALLEDLGRGRGEGAELARGAHRYARARGRPEADITVKGQELPAYDPRGAYGMALGYALSTRGGCHLRSYPIAHEILRKPVVTDRFSFAGKARIIKIAEDTNAAVDSLTACKFLFFAASLEEFARAYTAVTGRESTAQDLLQRGERTCYHERMMNLRCGFTAADDDLPARFFTEPGSSGEGIEIPPIDREDFLRARAAYYRIRGLDPEGRPDPTRAKELGIPCND